MILPFIGVENGKRSGIGLEFLKPGLMEKREEHFVFIHNVRSMALMISTPNAIIILFLESFKLKRSRN